MFKPLAVASEITIDDDVDVIPAESVVVIPTYRLFILLPIFSSSAVTAPSADEYPAGKAKTSPLKVGAETVDTPTLTVNVFKSTFSLTMNSPLYDV